VLRESTRPFTLNRRVKEDDEATQSLILRLLLELMGEGLDDDDPARQARERVHAVCRVCVVFAV
jgi:hypothetical protein